MAKKRVYVESSVVSYLTARPANDILKLAKQRQTHIFNPDTIEKLYSEIRKAGYKPSVLVRPDNLLEIKNAP